MFRESALMLKLQVSKDSVDHVPGYLCWTKEVIQFYGGFGKRALASVCPAAWKARRWLTGSKWIQGWKSLPSPSCQFWLRRDEEGLKLLSSFWWWMSESVISAYFLLVFLPISPLDSATSDTNRVSYQKLPAQGNKGNDHERWGTLSVLGFPLRWGVILPVWYAGTVQGVAWSVLL